MAAVTITGQRGSGATEIGRLIAKKLHAAYVDHDITTEVARLLNCQEQEILAKEIPPSIFLARVVTSLGHMPPMEVDSGVACIAYVHTWKTSPEMRFI